MESKPDLENQDRSAPSYLQAKHVQVMGILNITPDSFSDGGKWFDPASAVTHGKQMLQEGADIVDIGGESTAPGRQPVTAAEEIRRILPVIEALSKEGAVISCDTLHAQTAKAAVEAGAKIINDVSGGLADESMLGTVANLQKQDSDISYICQHWRATPQIANELAFYQDVNREVWRELSDRIDSMQAHGIDMNRVIIDPGLGFSKRGNQDWEILANLDTYLNSNFPVLIGPSRKRFLEAYESSTAHRHPRDDATLAVSLYCATKHVWAVRVHQVEPVAVSLRVLEKLEQIRQPTQPKV